MKRASIIISLLSLLFTIGCVEYVDLSSMQPEPKLVVNCLAMNGKPVMALVSRTFSTVGTYEEMIIPEANVHLYVNGEDKGRMVYMETGKEGYYHGVYVSTYSPKTEDIIRIEVNAEGYPEATAESRVPQPATIDKVEIEKKTVEKWEETYTSYTYHITFSDPVDENNYYYLFCEEGLPTWEKETNRFTGEYAWRTAYMNYSNEPLFLEEISALEHFLDFNGLSYLGRAFSDELINGTTYTITLELESWWGSFLNEHFPYWPDTDFDLNSIPIEERLPILGRVSFYSLSESFYLYMKSLIGLEDDRLIIHLVSAGLAEPIRIYNNIEGGLGILGTCHPYNYTIELGEMRENDTTY